MNGKLKYNLTVYTTKSVEIIKRNLYGTINSNLISYTIYLNREDGLTDLPSKINISIFNVTDKEQIQNST